MANIVRIDGHRTNKRTANMVREAEKLGGPLLVTQGSYNAGGVAASGGTHDGGGVLDFSVRGLSMTQINRRVRGLRTVGFAAWYRSPIPGVWGPHIHAVAGGTRDLAPLARLQWVDYKRGRNGLRGHALDRHRGMRVPVQTWEQYKRKRDARG